MKTAGEMVSQQVARSSETVGHEYATAGEIVSQQVARSSEIALLK